MDKGVENAVNYILKRDEDGNLLNPYLNEMESDLFLKLSSYDSTGGEAAMSTYQKKLKFELRLAIARTNEK
jgi:Holliday junction resolvasome RuvABC DNA-binding subunit